MIERVYCVAKRRLKSWHSHLHQTSSILQKAGSTSVIGCKQTELLPEQAAARRSPCTSLLFLPERNGAELDLAKRLGECRRLERPKAMQRCAMTAFACFPSPMPGTLRQCPAARLPQQCAVFPLAHCERLQACLHEGPHRCAYRVLYINHRGRGPLPKMHAVP